LKIVPVESRDHHGMIDLAFDINLESQPTDENNLNIFRLIKPGGRPFDSLGQKRVIAIIEDGRIGTDNANLFESLRLIPCFLHSSRRRLSGIPRVHQPLESQE
jgi:hypothetical protein